MAAILSRETWVKGKSEAWKNHIACNSHPVGNETWVFKVEFPGRHLCLAWIPRYCVVFPQWNGNVILMKFSSLGAQEVVKMTTSRAASDENFIKMTTFQIDLIENMLRTEQNSQYCRWYFPIVFSWRKMLVFWFRFHWSVFQGVQFTIRQQCFLMAWPYLYRHHCWPSLRRGVPPVTTL